MKKIIGLLLLLPLFAHAQSTGIQFESGLDWKQIQAKAKAEHKYIFMDCFATWCGPCKYMNKEIFTQKETGNFFNSHFINVRAQMDQTAKDDQQIRDWYADAAAIKKEYQVLAYPCYLFFSPDGALVHRLSGSRDKAKDFISDASEALDTKKQYYTMLTHEPEFKNDSVALFRALQTAMAIRDEKSVVLLGNDYVKIKNDLFSKQDITIVTRLLLDDHTYKKEGTVFLIKYARRIDSLMQDQNFAEHLVASSIYVKDVQPLFINDISPINWRLTCAELKNKYATLDDHFLVYEEMYFQQDVAKEIKFIINNQEPPITNWDKIFDSLQIQFPDYPALARVFLMNKAFYCEDHKLWADCVNTTYTLLKDHGEELLHDDINNFCWSYIFLHADDKVTLKEAIKWEKIILEKSDEKDALYTNWVDTYANLLYKTSDAKGALAWENKALEIVMKENNTAKVNAFQITIAKMKKGEKIWIGVRDTKNYSR